MLGVLVDKQVSDSLFVFAVADCALLTFDDIMLLALLVVVNG
jgi:hypothetical protein